MWEPRGAILSVAGGCNAPIPKPFSLLHLAPCYRVLRPRWCQSGVNWWQLPCLQDLQRWRSRFGGRGGPIVRAPHPWAVANTRSPLPRRSSWLLVRGEFLRRPFGRSSNLSALLRARAPRGLSVFRRSDPPQARRPGRFRLRPGDASARRLEAVLFSPLRFSRTSQPFPFFLLSCGFDLTAITGRKCLQPTSRRRRG
jgi:hypothetical protein